MYMLNCATLYLLTGKV